MEKVKTSDFNELINSNETVFVDFYATWCGPCKMMAPVVEKLAEEVQDVKFVKVDVDEEDDLAWQYNVNSIPTFIVFKNGKPVQKAIGYRDINQLKEMLK